MTALWYWCLAVFWRCDRRRACPDRVFLVSDALRRRLAWMACAALGRVPNTSWNSVVKRRPQPFFLRSSLAPSAEGEHFSLYTISSLPSRLSGPWGRLAHRESLGLHGRGERFARRPNDSLSTIGRRLAWSSLHDRRETMDPCRAHLPPQSVRRT
ncbi:hypothetical protein BJ546DRAFT_392257 [Cryomyces antarcticus]